MIINFKQLEAFIWVSDLGSFRRAAERLNTTQPNISARISALEQALNTKLMERDAGSVRLNAKGEQLLPQARKILRDVEELIETAGQSKRVEGVIKLGVTEMVVNTWLRQFLKQVKEEYPNLRIELRVDLSDNLRPALFSRSLDLTFQNGPFARRTSGSIDLGAYPFVWVASPELEIAHIKHPTCDEMKTFPILTHTRGTRLYEEIEGHFHNTKGKTPTIIPSSSLAPCQHMALDGLGLACLPAAMVHQDIADGHLINIEYSWLPTSLEFLARFDAKTAPNAVEKVAKLAGGIARNYPKTLTRQ